jgi:MoaA/NifB/PqqE/SkfB family radical SAM enzyme
MTQDNAGDLPGVLQLVEDEGIDRFYFSHLNYAGRGNKNRADDARHLLTREAMDCSSRPPGTRERPGRVTSPPATTTPTGPSSCMGAAPLPRPGRPHRGQAAQWGGNSSG